MLTYLCFFILRFFHFAILKSLSGIGTCFPVNFCRWHTDIPIELENEERSYLVFKYGFYLPALISPGQCWRCKFTGPTPDPENPRVWKVSTTVDVLTSSLDNSEAHWSSGTNDNIESFHFTINKIKTETTSAPLFCVLSSFHITCSFSYYLYAVGFQIVTSLTFFPKTHSQLLYLVWVLVWVLQVPQIYRYKASIFSSVTHLSKCAFFCTAVQTGSLRILFLTSPSSSFI